MLNAPYRWDLQHAVPFVLGHVEDHAVAQDSRGVGQDVQPAEVVDGRLDYLARGVELGDRVVVGDRPAAGLDYVIYGLVGGSGGRAGAVDGATDVVDNDRGALLGEQPGACGADASAGARDNRYPALKSVSHSMTSLFRLAESERNGADFRSRCRSSWA